MWLARARREVESQAKKMLMQGLELMVNTHTITAHTHAHITPSHHHLCMYVHYVLTYTDTHTFLLIIRTRAKWVWLCRCFTTSPSSPPHSSPSSLPTRKPYNTTFRMPSTHPPWFRPAMVGVQWNLSNNPDTNGAEESVIVSEVSSFRNACKSGTWGGKRCPV